MLHAEKLFFDSLTELFIGSEVNGISGYINLMRIKSKYFDTVFNILNEEINEKIQKFPDFKKELFQKLYNFFQRYFSVTGSSYYRRTPFHANIYERIYTDNKDVALFWKTHMLYYIKTDLLLRNMEIIIENIKFFFDVTGLEDKKGWEKRNLVYELKEVSPQKELVFAVKYSVKGKKTRIKDILKTLKHKTMEDISEDVLIKAFRVFEKQNQVDYFINKNLHDFLREQFDLWLYQYSYLDESQFSETRFKQLKLLQEIAYKIIAFISQFENELVKIWQKPKFTLNSNYVLTIDRIADGKKRLALLEKIINHPSFVNQIAEWERLKLIKKGIEYEKFKQNIIREDKLVKKYQFFPIDTKYFKDLEYEILSLFADGLDEALDGWLIRSENWQALNTLLKKFQNKVQLIYIDPPFNTGTNEFTMYINRFLDSAWITMMENRLNIAKNFLKNVGSLYVRIDYHGNHFTRLLLDDIFGKDNFRNEITIKRTEGKSRVEGESFSIGTESLFLYSKSKEAKVNIPVKKTELHEYTHEFLSKLKKINKELYEQVNNISNEVFWLDLDHRPGYRSTSSEIKVFRRVFKAPPGRHWLLSQKRINEAVNANRIRLLCINCNTKFLNAPNSRCSNCGKNKFKIQILYMEESVTTNWTDIQSYSQSNFLGTKFPTENSEQLLERILRSASTEGELVMDFFLGSGTTIATAHKMRRKWIGIEMGEHFHDIVLPRMKMVLAGKKSGISKAVNWQGGGFFKYYELEQFEETLQRLNYRDDEPLIFTKENLVTQYPFLTDLKFLEVMKLNPENNQVNLDFSSLYSNIDMHETLSNLLGIPIKRAGHDDLEFINGEKIKLSHLDYNLIKPLIWWEEDN